MNKSDLAISIVRFFLLSILLCHVLGSISSGDDTADTFSDDSSSELDNSNYYPERVTDQDVEQQNKVSKPKQEEEEEEKEKAFRSERTGNSITGTDNSNYLERVMNKDIEQQRRILRREQQEVSRIKHTEESLGIASGLLMMVITVLLCRYLIIAILDITHMS